MELNNFSLLRSKLLLEKIPVISNPVMFGNMLTPTIVIHRLNISKLFAN